MPESAERRRLADTMNSAATEADLPVVRFTRPPHAAGLELVHYPNLTRGWRGVPEDYTWFTMIERLEGDVEVISRGVRAQCAAGSVTIGAPGEPYALRPRATMHGDFRVIRVDNDRLDAMTEEIGARHGDSLFPREPQRDGELVDAFARLYRAVGEGDKLETQECLFAFLALLVGADRGGLGQSFARTSRAVQRARDLLHERFDTSLSLTELAEAAGTDKFALLRSFSHELGMTPHAYLMQLRMVRACRLIAQGVPLATVALAVGYSEQSALHRPFKRLVGVTPGAYARAMR